MLNSLRITTLALGGLLVAGLAPLPAAAQSYSWGNLDHASEPQTVQTSQNAQRAQRAAAPAQSQGVNNAPVAARDLRGTEYDQPGFIAYSWGLLEDRNDGHLEYHTWADVNRRLNAR